MLIIALRFFLIFASVSGLLAVVQKSNKRKSEKSTKNKNYVVLQLPELFFWIGVICTAIFAVILVFFSFSSEIGIIEWVVFTALLLLGVALIAAASFWKIELNRNEEFFIYTTSFGRRREIFYADITAWSNTQNGLKFKAKGKRYSVDKYAENYKKFLSILQQRAARACKGNNIARYPKVYIIVGIFTIIIGLSLLAHALIFPKDTYTWWVYLGIAGFVLLGTYLVLGGVNFYLILGTGEFTCRNFLRRTYTIPYTSVIRYKKGNNYLILYTKKKRIYFDNALPEYDKLIERLPCGRKQH